MTWVVSKHASKRIRKRLGLPKDAVEGMAQRASEEGFEAKRFSGSFRRYLDRLYFNQGAANRGVVFEGYVYLLAGQTLVTVLPVPQKYRSVQPKGSSQ